LLVTANTGKVVSCWLLVVSNSQYNAQLTSVFSAFANNQQLYSLPLPTTNNYQLTTVLSAFANNQQLSTNNCIICLCQQL